MKFITKIILIDKLYELMKKANVKRFFSSDFELENYFDEILDDNYLPIVTKLQTFSKKGKIAITSTNGKKSVAAIFAEILKKAGQSYITNVVDIEGVTLKWPAYLSIIDSIVKHFKVFKKEVKKDYFLMAFDDDELCDYFNSMKFDYLLLNNLFIDQKDEYSLEQKRKNIRQALILNSNINLIINADEPYFFKIDDMENDALIDKNIKKTFFGFNNVEFALDNISQKNDLKICPKCNCSLEWDKIFYSHIGKYNCDCNFKNPKPDILANAQIFKDYCFLDVSYKNENYVYKFPFGGIEAAYNALAAISLSYCLNIEKNIIASAFESYKGIKGVDEELEDGKIILKTVKNPTSLSQSLLKLYKERNAKVLIAFSDEKEDGFDTSWIFNSNFDALKSFENKIYVTGKRFDDMALRLKYAGVNPCLIVMEQDIKRALKCCYYDLKEDEKMFVITIPSQTKEILEIIKNKFL